MLVQNNAGVYQLANFRSSDLIHGFSSTTFGNLAFKYGPKIEVETNRQRFAFASKIDMQHVAQMDLAHSDKIAVVSAVDTRPLNKPRYLPGTDALVTAEKNVALWLLTADCAPFLFFDPVKKVIGLAHIGLRSALLDLPAKVIAVLEGKFGCLPGDILIGIGPAIRKCCYSFSVSLVPAADRQKWDNYLVPKNGQLFVDFVGYSTDRLRQVGVTQIVDSQYCVKHQLGFFSFRSEREGQPVGRFATVIQMT